MLIFLDEKPYGIERVPHLLLILERLYIGVVKCVSISLKHEHFILEINLGRQVFHILILIFKFLFELQLNLLIDGKLLLIYMFILILVK